MQPSRPSEADLDRVWAQIRMLQDRIEAAEERGLETDELVDQEVALREKYGLFEEPDFDPDLPADREELPPGVGRLPDLLREPEHRPPAEPSGGR